MSGKRIKSKKDIIINKNTSKQKFFKDFCEGCPLKEKEKITDKKTSLILEKYKYTGQKEYYEAIIISDMEILFYYDFLFKQFGFKSYKHINLTFPCGKKNSNSLKICYNHIFSRYDYKFLIIFGDNGMFLFNKDLPKKIEYKVFSFGEKIIISLPSFKNFLGLQTSDRKNTAARAWYFEEAIKFIKKIKKLEEENKLIVVKQFKIKTWWGDLFSVTTKDLVQEMGKLKIKYLEEKDLYYLLNQISHHKYVVLDIETTGLEWDAELVSVAFYVNGTSYVAFGDILQSFEFRNFIRSIFSDESIIIVGHNLSFDISHLFYHYNIHNPLKILKKFKPIHDTASVRYTLSTELAAPSLKALAGYLFIAPVWDISDEGVKIIDKIASIKTETDLKNILLYNSYDVFFTYKIWKKYRHVFNSKYYEILRRLFIITLSMTLEGLKIDKKEFNRRKKGLMEMFEKVSKEIEEKYGLDPSSTKDLKNWLKKKKANIPFRTAKGDISITKNNLPILIEKKDVLELSDEVVELLKLSRLRAVLEHQISAFFTAYEKLETKKTGKIHPKFNVNRTVSGRLSSEDPNVQQIPSRVPLKFMLSEEEQDLFKVKENFWSGDPDYLIMGFDLSQAEVRMQAFFSQDPQMLKIYIEDKDIYKELASQALEKPIDQITKDERQMFKQLVLGMQYGMSALTLANALEISKKEAQVLIDSYFKVFKYVKIYRQYIQNYVISFMKKYNLMAVPAPTRKRYLLTRYIPKKYLPGILSYGNTPIQGFTSDLTLLTLFQLIYDIYDEKYKEDPDIYDKVRLMNVIHDAIYLIVHKDYEKYVEEKIVYYFNNPFDIMDIEMYTFIVKNLKKTFPVYFDIDAAIIVPFKIEKDVADVHWKKGG